MTRRRSLWGGRVNRVRFVTHQGKQILFIDMTNCASEEAMVIASEVRARRDRATAQFGITLSDLTGGEFRRNAVAQ